MVKDPASERRRVPAVPGGAGPRARFPRLPR
jgi:hypothetical protein